MDKKLRLSIWRNSNMLREKRIGLNKFMINQLGGSGRKLKIEYNNNKYIYEEAMDENYYVLYSFDNFECVSILIDKTEKIAEIHGIGDYKTCIREDNNKVGSTLLIITIKMLKKYKEKLGINKITLTDNSVKKCNEKDIKLSMMLTLLTGNTWYGKYGFRPRDKSLIEYYENNIKIMNKVKLKHIDLIKYFKKTKLNKEVIENTKVYIKKHQDLLLKDYLTKFLKEYDKTCEYFHDFYLLLFIDLKLYNFYHNTFELDI